MKFEAKFDVIKTNKQTRDFNKMKKKIEQKYNLKENHTIDSPSLKLKAPKNTKKVEKIIGFDDFKTQEEKDDFSSFPDAFTDSWDNPSSKKKKKAKAV